MAEEKFEGYVVIHLEDVDGKPPITGITMAMGILWYGTYRPTHIFSSTRELKRMLRVMKPQAIKPEVLLEDGNATLGINFNGAIWVDRDNCGDRIYVLNDKFPHSPKFNGYYTPSSEGL